MCLPFRRRLRLRGMALRLGLLVLATSLVTALAISWVSVGAVETVLHDRIERNLPEYLEAAQIRLDLWYQKRLLDLEQATRDAGLRVAVGAETSSAGASRALDVLRERHPEFAALRILTAVGGTWASSGKAPELTPEIGRELATLHAPTATGLLGKRRDAPQVLVVPLSRRPSARVLVGVIDRQALEAAIRGTSARESALAIVDASGRVVAGDLQSPLHAARANGRVHIVDSPGGARFVVAMRPLERFGWAMVISQEYESAFASVRETLERTMLTNVMLATLSCAVAMLLVAWRMQPIGRLAHGASRLAAGDADVRVSEEGAHGEVKQLAEIFNDMAARLAANREELELQNTELTASNEILEQLSITDGLTKLHNHRHFQDHFAREARRAMRSDETLTLVLIDIDDFKKLNDRLGHSTGDRVLVAVAETMHDVIRGTDYVARYGGEEFALILPDTSVEGAVGLAERLRPRDFGDRSRDARRAPAAQGLGLLRNRRVRRRHVGDLRSRRPGTLRSEGRRQGPASSSPTPPERGGDTARFWAHAPSAVGGTRLARRLCSPAPMQTRSSSRARSGSRPRSRASNAWHSRGWRKRDRPGPAPSRAEAGPCTRGGRRRVLGGGRPGSRVLRSSSRCAQAPPAPSPGGRRTERRRPRCACSSGRTAWRGSVRREAREARRVRRCHAEAARPPPPRAVP